MIAEIFALAGDSVFTDKLLLLVFFCYLVVSCITFLAYACDKSAAKNGRWRPQESALHLFALAGGWPGALVAQKVLRHKSRKQSFQFMFWVTVAINCGSLAWLLS